MNFGMKHLVCFLMAVQWGSVFGNSKELYEEFIKSFVVHYDFSPEGRYTHEYHPFLLNQTRLSFEKLERVLASSGFDCAGRMVVMGYQQEGVPSYYSCLRTTALHDEASLSSKRGRVVPAHNIFGFLTGFLLKDVNWFQKQWFPAQPLCVEHILPERVDLFDDQAYVFQKHAFGRDFETILQHRKRVEKSIKTGNPLATLQELIVFWERAYKGELKSCGQEILATQDILFSIDYAKHLMTSSIPLSKLYVGPDITYPIELLSFQEQEATECAQYFVKLFTQRLTPVEGKKTAYIFCSFVDGVGKSTLLGNVINWSKHGDDLASYERVDNASSQKGVLYSLKDDVFIMDLPAQLSHWVGKPDGHVFVDMACVHDLSDTERHAVTRYVLEHSEDLKKQFYDAQQTYQEQGKKPEGLLGNYLENLMLFRPDHEWIPFLYNDLLCLFDESHESSIRVLVPLEGVHSKGLKVAQPEQMIFDKGLRLPLTFDVFLDDIVRQCKDAGIEKLVFVDFLSMYPRSSRENVRVIFLLQQLKKLYHDYFSIEMSLYRSFVNREAELYHAILHHKQQFFTSLFLESMVRTLLYSIFTKESSDTLTLLSFDQVTELLRKEAVPFFETSSAFLQEAVEKKLNGEHAALQRYAYDAKYELFTRFSWEPLIAFSRFMEDLFGYRVRHSYFQTLWQGMEGSVANDTGDIQKSSLRGKAAEKALHLLGDGGGSEHYLTTGVSIRCLESVSCACRDSVTLAPLFPVIRAHWYMALANLLECEECEPGVFSVQEPLYHVAPLTCKQLSGQHIALVQKQLEPLEGQPPVSALKKLIQFNHFDGNRADIQWAAVGPLAHCLDWSSAATYFGIYAFGCDWDLPIIRDTIEKERAKKVKAGYQDPAVFAADLVSIFDQYNLWQQFSEMQSSMYGVSAGKKKKIAVDSARGRAIALWVRSIATLEMIVKDQYSPLFVRKGVKTDFVAALRLLEKVTLPRYFGIVLDKNLFADYNAVEPVIGWQSVR